MEPIPKTFLHRISISVARKRFYKTVSVTRSDNRFEINLDSRKLKTPHGNIFYTTNEPLALAVMNEWDTQQEKIETHNMHLTTLINTAIDNPSHHNKEVFCEKIIQFLDSDTICFQSSEPPELAKLQSEKWDPVIEWFEYRFSCKVPIKKDVIVSPVSDAARLSVYRHLTSHNDWSLLGMSFVTENLKSLLLTLALTERVINVDDAVSLSLLETEFQTEQWGRVDWAHDLDLHTLRSRVAAGLLFHFLNCESSKITQKT